MSDLRRGRIVRVEVLDPQNRNPKIRPAIILTPTEEIRPDGDLVLVAITGSVNAAPADVEVTLPWHRQGRTTTRLNKPSVAVCTWVFTSPVSSIRALGGIVPARPLLQILEKIKALTPPETPSTYAPLRGPAFQERLDRRPRRNAALRPGVHRLEGRRRAGEAHPIRQAEAARSAAA